MPDRSMPERDADPVREVVERVRELNRVGPKVSRFLRPLFRNQGGVNRNLAHAMELLARDQTQLLDEIRSQRGELQGLREALERARRCEDRQAAGIAQLTAMVHRADRERAGLSAALDQVICQMRASSEEDRQAFERLRRKIEKLRHSHESNLERIHGEYQCLREGNAALEASLEAIGRDLDATGSVIQAASGRLTRFSEHGSEASPMLEANLDSNHSIPAEQTPIRQASRAVLLEEFFKELEASLARQVSHRKDIESIVANLQKWSGSLGRYANVSNSRRPWERDPEVANKLEIAAGEFERFYRRFEDTFRGSEASVTEKQKVHLTRVQDVLAGLDTPPAIALLDLGCGRGEWLQVAAKSGVSGVGVEANSESAQDCRARGLEVEASDMLDYLHRQKDGSVGVVTCFHVIEHLSFNELWALFREVIRVLAKSGMALFETPNPMNLRVAAHFFYTDVTHVRLVPPTLAAFLARQVGATEVEILESLPFPESKTHADLPREVDDSIYGPQDYAICFRK
ncbi:MAG: methyltransferase domain-containing protein [Puniceicoccaceae bacterium]|nr:MAG: methyltransferase domain-containing protein [Puniceicoccaceae bacterium]